MSVLSDLVYQKVNADKRRLVDAFDLAYKLQGRLFFPRDHLGCHLGYATRRSADRFVMDFGNPVPTRQDMQSDERATNLKAYDSKDEVGIEMCLILGVLEEFDHAGANKLGAGEEACIDGVEM